MLLAEAIELVSDSAHKGVTTFSHDYRDAQILLIDAGIAIKAWRRDWNADRFHLLPHETPTPATRTPAKTFGDHRM